jgi:hypothetical protein
MVTTQNQIQILLPTTPRMSAIIDLFLPFAARVERVFSLACFARVFFP